MDNVHAALVEDSVEALVGCAVALVFWVSILTVWVACPACPGWAVALVVCPAVYAAWLAWNKKRKEDLD